jgi:HSP20 family protein
VAELNRETSSRGVMKMLMRTDPFRELDRLNQQVLGTASRPAVMPMDAWRNADEFIVEFDLPGVKAEDVDLDIERNVLTVKAERPISDDKDTEMIAAERPRGVFSRQLFLGDNLDTDRVNAEYDAVAVRLSIPVAEQAKPHKITIASSGYPDSIKS